MIHVILAILKLTKLRVVSSWQRHHGSLHLHVLCPQVDIKMEICPYPLVAVVLEHVLDFGKLRFSHYSKWNGVL